MLVCNNFLVGVVLRFGFRANKITKEIKTNRLLRKSNRYDLEHEHLMYLKLDRDAEMKAMFFCLVYTENIELQWKQRMGFRESITQNFVFLQHGKG